MQSNLNSDTSSNEDLLSYVKESEVELDEEEVPSVGKIIVIERTAVSDRTISFKKITDSEEKFETPVSFTEKNRELIRKKYSKKNKDAKDHIAEAIIRYFGKFPFSELNKIFTCEKSDNIMSLLFVVSAYTIENRFGKTSPKSVDSKVLHLFIHELFGLDKDQENVHLELVKQINPPDFNLNLIILEARGLKKLSDIRNLYCAVWISSEPKVVEITNLVQEMAHPVWNVKFFFPIENLKTDVITIELRGTENDTLKESDVHEIFDLKNILRRHLSRKSTESEEGKDHGLIGEIEIPVSEVYSEGLDEWVAVECNNSEYGSIFLHIRSNFEVIPLKTYSHGIKRHLLLLRMCIENNISHQKDKIFRTEELFNNCVLTLIFLHRVISGIPETEDVLCRFVVITHLGIQTESVSYELLYYLLDDTVDHLKRSLDFFENHLESMYEEEVEKMHDYCLNFISNLHFYYVTSKGKMLSEFKFALKSIYLCEDITDLKAAPLMTLKSESLCWLERKAGKIYDQMPENRVLFVTEFLDYLLQFHKGVDDVIRQVIHDETYTELIYEELQNILLEPFKFSISEYSNNYLDSTDTERDEGKIKEQGIEIFAKLKELVMYISNAVGIPVVNLKLSKFPEWFGMPVITSWFHHSQIKAERIIEKVIASDDLKAIDISFSSHKSYKESISAREMHRIIKGFMKELWLLLSFPRSDECDNFFLCSLRSCCMKYSALLKEIISSRKLLEKFQTEGRTCLCILMNNLWFTSALVEDVVLDTVETTPNFPDTKLKLEEDFQEICSKTVDKYFDDIARLLKSIVEKKHSIDKVDITEYLNYVERMVWDEIFIDCSFDVFRIFLKHTSQRIITLLKQYTEDPKFHNKEKRMFFTLLKVILTQTKNVCEIPDNPDETALIWDENYIKFLAYLEKKIAPER